MQILYHTQTLTWYYTLLIGAPIFPNYLNTRAKLCKNNFYPETFNSENVAAAMRNNFVRRERNQRIHQLKKNYNVGEYKTCWTVPLCSCFIFRLSWRRFELHRTVPLKWSKLSASTNKLSRFFVEQGTYNSKINKRRLEGISWRIF